MLHMSRHFQGKQFNFHRNIPVNACITHLFVYLGIIRELSSETPMNFYNVYWHTCIKTSRKKRLVFTEIFQIYLYHKFAYLGIMEWLTITVNIHDCKCDYNVIEITIILLWYFMITIKYKIKICAFLGRNFQKNCFDIQKYVELYMLRYFVENLPIFNLICVIFAFLCLFSGKLPSEDFKDRKYFIHIMMDGWMDG